MILRSESKAEGLIVRRIVSPYITSRETMLLPHFTLTLRSILLVSTASFNT